LRIRFIWLESALISTLEPIYQVNNWFQTLLFQMGQLVPLRPVQNCAFAFCKAGLCTSRIQLTHKLETARFQPSSLWREKLVSKFAF
jgi:hypothetical protein